MLPNPLPHIIGTVDSDFLSPRNQKYTKDISYERGGIALQDVSTGLLSHNWRAWLEKATDNDVIKLKRTDLADDTAVVVATDIDISEIDFTFDQLMRPCVTWVSNNTGKLSYYDTVSQSQIVAEFDSIANPRLSLDDKRQFNLENSDIIFAYLKDNRLHCRIQRERYQIEHDLDVDFADKELVKIGMGSKHRFLFMQSK